MGDKVRISKLRGVFRKGHEQTFTDEFFTITERIARDPPVYKLVDCAGEPVKGTFYEPELQLVIVDKNKFFKIEKKLARKKPGRKKMVLVKWLGWPEKFNSWVSEKQLVHLVIGCISYQEAISAAAKWKMRDFLSHCQATLLQDFTLTIQYQILERS